METKNKTNQEMIEALQETGNYRVIERFSGNFLLGAGTGQSKIGVIVDTETTGKDNPPGKNRDKVDKIIELGMLKFRYDPESGDVLEILDRFCAFEDPGMPIPEEATAINGITDEMVAGHLFDDDEVEKFVEDAQLIIAHNASFDRQYLEERFSFFKLKPWACTFRQLDWAAEGISSAKLEFIAYMLGFYYEAHRALADCEATLRILQEAGPHTLEPLLAQLDKNSYKKLYRVWADNAKFEVKDTLKEYGFRWFEQGNFQDAVFKAWYIEVEETELDDTLVWLRTNVYFGKSVTVTVQKIDAFSNFSRRVTRNGIKSL